MGIDTIRPKSDASLQINQPSSHPISRTTLPPNALPLSTPGSNQQRVSQPPSSNNSIETLKDIYGEKKLKQIGVIPCVTCASRVYQDASNDPGVSFKSPTHISPEQSHSAVLAHENEHVQREQQKATEEDREIVSQSVTLSRALCPECGKSYISGGLTKTVTQTKPRYNEPTSEQLKGLFVDKKT